MKKKLILIILFFCSINTFCQTPDSTFKLKGHIAKMNEGMLFFYYPSFKKYVTDSAKVSNGYFELTGKIAIPSLCYIRTVNTNIIDDKTLYLFLEPTYMTIEITNDPLAIIKVRGSKTQDELVEWKDADKVVKLKYNNVINHTASKSDSLKQKNYEDSLVLYTAEKHQVEYDFIKRNPQSYVIGVIMKSNYRFYTVPQLREIYNNLGAVVQNSPYGRYLLTHVPAVMNNLVNGIAENIVSKDYITDKDFDLSALKGKYVLLDFWGSWCVPCLNLLPNMVEENKKYKGKNIVLVSVCDDHDKNLNQCKSIVKKLGMNWVNLWSSQDRKDSVSIANQYKVGIFPTFILIDPNGKIIERNDSEAGYFKIKALLENAFNL
jgi:thiol-disulfide isomerase/thioredoxin